MFARATNTVHVCLRCQKRLARIQALNIAPPRSPHNSTRRWQSQAVAQFEEDGDEIEASAETKDQPRSYTIRPHQRAKGDRLWKLTPYKELGVNALGAPAEIIVLPSRGRVIPVVPEDVDENIGEGVREALELERAPVNWEDTKRNITLVRALIGQDDGTAELDHVQWKKLKRSLHTGFTRKQLMRFIEESGTTAIASSSLESANKSGLIQIIARDIWQCRQAADEEIEESVKQAEISFGDGIDRLDALLMNPEQPFRKVANKHQIKLDVFRSQKRIRISGADEKVNAAKIELMELKQSITRKKLLLSAREQSYFAAMTPDLVKNYLYKLSSKHSMLVRLPNSKNLELFFTQGKADAVEHLQRDLIIASRKVDRQDKIVWWPEDLSTMTPIQYQIPSPNREEKHAQWLRVTSLQTDTRKNDATTEFKFTKAEQKRLKSRISTITDSLLSQSIKLPQSPSFKPRYEISANFAQVVFEHHSLNSQTIKPGQLVQNPTKFITQIPFLAQYLSQLILPIDHDQHQRDPNTSYTPPRSYRMQFAPRDIDSGLPWFDIHLNGTRSNYSGLDQPLEIVGVTASLNVKRHALLLPGKAVDIIFSSTIKQDVFVRGSSSSNIDCDTAKLLQSFAVYMTPTKVSESDAHVKHKFKPFLDILIPPALKKFATTLAAATPTGSADSLSPSSVDAKPVSNTSATASTTKPKKKSSSAPSLDHYVLMTIDPIDSTVFPLPDRGDLALEHRIYATSISTNSLAQSQSLRLIQMPPPPPSTETDSDPSALASSSAAPSSLTSLESIPSSVAVKKSKTPNRNRQVITQSDFAKFFEHAMEVAGQIDSMANKYSQQMQ